MKIGTFSNSTAHTYSMWDSIQPTENLYDTIL